MPSLLEEITQLKQQCLSTLKTINSLDSLEQFRITFLGRQGTIAQLMPRLKELSLEDKKIIGPAMNNLKQEVQETFDAKQAELEKQLVEQQIYKQKFFDVTAYEPHTIRGTLHPLSYMYKKVQDIFISMGYAIAYGPEVETEYYNFEALNIPEDHPARDEWDTLWLDIPGLLLRTHTSPVQIHAMKNHSLPLAVIAPGRAYRHEATDATHDFMFNQLELLVIDKNISLAQLLGTIKVFFRKFFEKEDLEIRVRSSYFPFVEPGIEVDVSCPFCKHGCSICKKTGWIEIGGAGLVHPDVLRCSNIDTNHYSGFAFGFGLDRLTMLQYHINDIRLFSSGKLEFLKQF